jgi:hypothetical protein
MAATPFGGHPTFAQYLDWARSVGCLVKYGISTSSDGSPSRIIMIDDPTRKFWVHVVEVQETEYLLPTMIAYLDRRLHLKSPFFAIDASNPSASYIP